MGSSAGEQGFANVLNAEGSQYALFAVDSIRQSIEQKIASSESLNWWLRSANPETTTQFFTQGSGYDTEQANPLSMDANDTLSVIVGFCI